MGLYLGNTEIGAISTSLGGGGSSANIDVTASVGQTIIVKEVDAKGNPTKWEAADYQPRTHWTEEVVVIPQTTLAVEEGVAFIDTDFNYVVGKEYRVTFNGTEYVCTAVNAQGVAAIGNTDIMLDTGDNGMPFFSIQEYGLAFAVLDGSTSITVSIIEVNYTPIPRGYLSNVLPYYITITGLGTVDNPYSCYDTVANVMAIYENGKQLIVRLEGSGGMTAFLYLYVYDGVKQFAFSGGSYASLLIVLTAQDDGTFAVSKTLDSSD